MSMPEMPMPETDVAELIRSVNATNNAVEDQCLRTRRAADAASGVPGSPRMPRPPRKRPGSHTRPSRPNVPGGARPCRARSSWRLGPSHSTAWPATSPPRRSVAARTAPWYGRSSSSPRWPEGKSPWTTIETVTSASGGPWPSPSDPSYRCSASSVSGSWPLSKMAAWFRRSPGLVLFTAATAGFLALDTGHCGPPRRRRHGVLAGRLVKRGRQRGPRGRQRTET